MSLTFSLLGRICVIISVAWLLFSIIIAILLLCLPTWTVLQVVYWMHDFYRRVDAGLEHLKQSFWGGIAMLREMKEKKGREEEKKENIATSSVQPENMAEVENTKETPALEVRR